MDLLQLVTPQRIRDDRYGLGSPATHPQHFGEVHERVCLRIDPVGPERKINRFSRKRLSRLDVARRASSIARAPFERTCAATQLFAAELSQTAAQ